MIYDISREMFSTPTFPGDPVPETWPHTSFDKPEPDIYQVTVIKITGHTGTHADAPYPRERTQPILTSPTVSAGAGYASTAASLPPRTSAE